MIIAFIKKMFSAGHQRYKELLQLKERIDVLEKQVAEIKANGIPDICPLCHKNRLKHRIDCFDETKEIGFYQHFQTEIEFCDCGYTKILDEKIVKTGKAVTDCPQENSFTEYKHQFTRL